MNTIASTFFSSPPLTSPALDSAAKRQQRIHLVGSPIFQREEVALGH